MNIQGLGVAMITPLTKEGEIDFQALKEITERQISGGVDFLVVMGTTGESVTLELSEKRKVLDTVLSVNSKRIPIIYGLGGNNTKAVVSELKTFNLEGVSAILSVSPSYNKPTQEGIFQHFKHISEASPVPVMVYNVPGRTASNVTAETCLRIAHELPNVFSVKEASGDLDQIKSIITHAPEGFLIFAGDDGLAIPVIKAGGAGVISVVGNALPKMFSELVTSAMNDEWIKAKELDQLFQPLIPLLFKEGNPAGIKAIMEINGECTSVVRLPLMEASSRLKEELKLQLQSFQTVV
ncbi:MAG: 4-hydroxy-tetrahydrodipicolinate synthase [Flavobacteriales bacterium]